MNKKKGKPKTAWVCESCGHSEGQWWGSCRACNKVGTMRRFSEASSESRGSGIKASGSGLSEGTGLSWLPEQAAMQPLKLTSVIHGITQQQWRISLYALFLDFYCLCDSCLRDEFCLRCLTSFIESLLKNGLAHIGLFDNFISLQSKTFCLLDISFLVTLADLNDLVLFAFIYMMHFMFRPGHFGNEVGRVLGGGLAPGCMLSS